MPFEVNGTYANRIGQYKVLALNPPKMTVRYQDGSEAELNIAIQARIWENIEAEMEAKQASRMARQQRGINVNHYVKAVTVMADGDPTFPGWAERVVAVTAGEEEPIKQGDRIIYYGVDTKTFFAVATITGDGYTADPKEYFYKTDASSWHFFPVDVDATAIGPEDGIPVESVEMESQPQFRKLKLTPESYLKINEDDFELLAEWLTELSEEEVDDDDFDEDEFEEDDE
ncbi:MAG: EVE domain-containing protein [Chloroflexota bacterium]|jgi:hypothetical protein